MSEQREAYNYGDKVRIKPTSLDPLYHPEVKQLRDTRTEGVIVGMDDFGTEYDVGFPNGDAYEFTVDELERVPDALAAAEERVAVLEAALKRIASMYVAYQDYWEVYGKGKQDFESLFWEWFVPRASASHMRMVFEAAAAVIAAGNGEAE